MRGVRWPNADRVGLAADDGGKSERAERAGSAGGLQSDCDGDGDCRLVHDVLLWMVRRADALTRDGCTEFAAAVAVIIKRLRAVHSSTSVSI